MASSLHAEVPMQRALVKLVLLAALLVAGCGIDPAKIAGHEIYADDGALVTAPRTLTFAVVGNTFTAQEGKEKEGAPAAAVGQRLVDDLAAQLRHERLSFLVLVGDMVPASTVKGWAAFDAAMRNLLKGTTDPETPRIRMPVLPVAGEREFRTDRFLKGFGAAFPGVGAEIGYNRVGAWYAFDAKVRDATWRFLVLDSNKAALGPRWKEQLYWIPRAVENGEYDHLVVFMHHPLVSLVPDETEPNQDGAPAELLEIVEDSIGLMKLRAVFFGDPGTSELYMLGGRFGTLHVTAGGGGGRLEDLHRWGHVRAAGIEATQLEPIFDTTLQGIFNERAAEQNFPEVVIDAAQARGSYEGFPGMYDRRYFPLYGYWWVEIRGHEMSLIFRLHDPADGSFADVYRVGYTEQDGWKPGS
ncbi:MAG: hypothetical protein ABIO70_13230 [Pseudomonadota bacterium]